MCLCVRVRATVCVPDLLEPYESLCSNYSLTSTFLPVNLFLLPSFPGKIASFSGKEKKKFDWLMRSASSITADAAG